jgi:hypothetical protein
VSAVATKTRLEESTSQKQEADQGLSRFGFVPSVLIPTQLRLFVIPTRGTIWLPFRQ